jgi:hypothetical protein
VGGVTARAVADSTAALTPMIAPDAPTIWPGLVIGILTLAVLVGQLLVFQRQASIMQSQAETSATQVRLMEAQAELLKSQHDLANLQFEWRRDEAEESSRCANRGAKILVSRRRSSSLPSPNCLKTQRPALRSAGRAGLRIESSTTELRWRGGAASNLATCFSPRYSTAVPGGAPGLGLYRRLSPPHSSRAPHGGQRSYPDL